MVKEWKGLRLSTVDAIGQLWTLFAKAADESRPLQASIYAELLGQLLVAQMYSVESYRAAVSM